MDEESKRKRQTQSCDRCKFKKRKCDGAVPCSNCVKAGAECTMLIAQKKRGPKPTETNHVSKRSKKQELSLEIPAPSYLPDVNGDSIGYENPCSSNADFIVNLDAELAQSLYWDPNQGLDESVSSTFGSAESYPAQFCLQDFVPNQQQLQIDPEILSLYTQINPKLSLQQDLSNFLATQEPQVRYSEEKLTGPVNLSIPEVPNLSSEVFLHMISMFFTYFHPNFPIIEEETFFQNLIPINKHHPMLLYSIYAIGCNYSRHPALYQSPFFTPLKASQFFINKAFVATPPLDSKSLSSFEALSICQASLLLANCDFSARKCRAWMTIGMATRLIAKYELQSSSNDPDFFSLFNGHSKCDIQIPQRERKRIWWTGLLADLYVSLSTGAPLMINEEDFTDSLISCNKSVVNETCKLASLTPFLSANVHTRVFSENSPTETEKWKPFFSGFPKSTIFGGTDLTSDRWKHSSSGFFQINHLFSNLDEFLPLVQLGFITRKVFRYAKRPKASSLLDVDNGPAFLLKALDSRNEGELNKLHDVLIAWYDNLPPGFKLWDSLSVLNTDDDIGKSCTMNRISSTSLHLNILYFFTLSLLHQKEAEKTSMGATAPPHLPVFRVHPTHISIRPVTCLEIIAMCYRAQMHILKLVYGPVSPSPTAVPPVEISASGIMSCLLMAAPMALLSQSPYSSKLTASVGSEDRLLPLDSMLLPVLDNIGQVWPIASHHASILRLVVSQLRSNVLKTTPVAASTPDIVSKPLTQNIAEKPIIKKNMIPSIGTLPIPPANGHPKSWQDVQKEFEDEFLL